MKRLLGALLAGIGVFAVLSLMFGLPAWLTWHKDKVLERTYVRTEASIIMGAVRRAGCKYMFVVDGKVYTAHGQECADEVVGNTIHIYYAPNDPNNSDNVTPGGKRLPIFFLLWALGLMPTMAAFGFYFKPTDTTLQSA